MKLLTIDGHLGKDAELMKTPKGNEYVSFSLANTTYIKGEEKTEWYDVAFFNPAGMASLIPHLKKGKYVSVSGIPDAKPYIHKDGSLRLDLTLFGKSIDFLSGGKKPDNQSSIQESYAAPVSAPYPSANAQQPSVVVPQPQPMNPSYAPQPQVQIPIPQQMNYTPQAQPMPQPSSGFDSGDDLPF